MKNWKLGTRIAAGFAAVILIASAVGVFAYNKVGILEKSSAQIAANALPSVYLIGQVQNGIEKEFSLAQLFVSSTDRDDRVKLEADIQASRTANGERRNQYKNLITSERQQALFDALMASRNAYVGMFDDVLKIARTGTEEAHRRANDLVSRQLRGLEAKYLENAASLVAYSRSAAEQDSKAVQEAAGSARRAC